MGGWKEKTFDLHQVNPWDVELVIQCIRSVIVNFLRLPNITNGVATLTLYIPGIPKWDVDFGMACNNFWSVVAITCNNIMHMIFSIFLLFSCNLQVNELMYAKTIVLTSTNYKKYFKVLLLYIFLFWYIHNILLYFGPNICILGRYIHLPLSFFQ